MGGIAPLAFPQISGNRNNRRLNIFMQKRQGRQRCSLVRGNSHEAGSGFFPGRFNGWDMPAVKREAVCCSERHVLVSHSRSRGVSEETNFGGRWKKKWRVGFLHGWRGGFDGDREGSRDSSGHCRIELRQSRANGVASCLEFPCSIIHRLSCRFVGQAFSWHRPKRCLPQNESAIPRFHSPNPFLG